MKHLIRDEEVARLALENRTLEATNHVFMTGEAVEVFSGQWNGD